MRRHAAVLLIAISPFLPARGAAAPAPAGQPDIVVTGENRIVCRQVRRTATRMRVGRLCRRQSEWRAESAAAIRDGADPNATIDGAADTLEVLGQMTGAGAGPLGPR